MILEKKIIPFQFDFMQIFSADTKYNVKKNQKNYALQSNINFAHNPARPTFSV